MKWFTIIRWRPCWRWYFHWNCFLRIPEFASNLRKKASAAKSQEAFCPTAAVQSTPTRIFSRFHASYTDTLTGMHKTLPSFSQRLSYDVNRVRKLFPVFVKLKWKFMKNCNKKWTSDKSQTADTIKNWCAKWFGPRELRNHLESRMSKTQYVLK